MDLSSLGKGIVIVGLLLIVVGALFWLLARTGLPVGRLPGDIRIERGNMSCYAPIATLILMSVVLTILVNVLVRLLNR